jgi:beta-galactosidase/beta-glucuronidase
MMSTTIPRPEHPRPQLVRGDWINLNGTWSFETDPGVSGRERGLVDAPSLSGSIVVPFCPESRLSGVANTDFMNAVWYKRSFELPAAWSGSRVLLHFGAVDYETEVWVNGISAGQHKGGYSSFTFDITGLLRPGMNFLTVCAEDDSRSGRQPRGKQSGRYHSHGCDYTRTTGIWQTVWLERVPQTYVVSIKATPDVANSCLHVEAAFNRHMANGRWTATSTFDGRGTGSASVVVSGRGATVTLPLSEAHLWGPGHPALYDLALTLETAEGVQDRSQSYFGLRSVGWDDTAMLLNGERVFQRLILDQGFYPEGIYTAPTDDDLRGDIERSMACGYNGARLHQKIFEERFLYWADRLGYLVWGEHANWGLDIKTAAGLENFLPEWMETLRRDYGHPSIVGWCPFNETQTTQDNQVLAQVYAVTKLFDASRPVIDTSGYVHVVTDIYDVHDYGQDPVAFAARYQRLMDGGEVYRNFPTHERYEGQPYFVSEFGGIKWDKDPVDPTAWGYGDGPKTEEEFLARYQGLVDALLDNPKVCALCYTQLTDVEQEVNGLYTYDRKPKFDVKVLHAITSRKAAIEI